MTSMNQKQERDSFVYLAQQNGELIDHTVLEPTLIIFLTDATRRQK